MKYNVAAIPNFSREIKKLSKKFPSLKNDFAKLIESLQDMPSKELTWATIATKSVWQ